jgi:hypothetical protein
VDLDLQEAAVDGRLLKLSAALPCMQVGHTIQTRGINSACDGKVVSIMVVSIVPLLDISISSSDARAVGHIPRCLQHEGNQV